MRRILHRLSLLVVVAFAAAACQEHPVTPPLGSGEASLALYANVGVAGVAELAIEVTAPDISTPLVFNLPVEDGIASGSLRLPAGSDRLITVRGFSTDGSVTHHGEATVTVREGENPPVSITLLPLAGDQPIEVRFGSRVVVVHPGDVYLQVGDGFHMSAEVLNQNGEFISTEVRWASTNPARATVDENGYVQAKRSGVVEIVATYEGTAGSAQLHISGQDGQENNTTDLLDIAISPSEVNVTGASAEVQFSVVLRDLDHGVRSFDVSVQSPTTGLHRYCAAWDVAEGDRNEGTWQCSIEVPADSDPGEWRITSIGADNYSGGWTYFGEHHLSDAGLPGTFTVISDDPDLDAPELHYYSASTDSIHVPSDDGVEVTLYVEASDVGTGIERIQLDLVNEEHNWGNGCVVYPEEGNRHDVQLSCTVWFSQASPAGTWTGAVWLWDRAGNQVRVDHGAMEADGYPVVVVVTHEE